MAEQSITLIGLETECVALTIKGPASHLSFSGIEIKDKEASLSITCDDCFNDDLLKVDHEVSSIVQLGSGMVAQYKMIPVFYEQRNYELIIETKDGHKVEFFHDNPNVRKSITPVGNSGLLSGVINFANEIGYSDLVILVDGKRYLTLTIEVFPSKISYKDDYKELISDVIAEVYNLVFDFLRKTYESLDIAYTKQASPVEFFAIIIKIYSEFIVAADMVIAKPHHMLEKEYRVLPEHKVKRTDNRSIRWIEKHPEHVMRAGNEIKIDKAMSVKKYVTYDTKENRLTKYILQITAKRLENFKVQYNKLARDNDEVIINEIDSMINGINRRLNTGFFKEVSAMPANSGMSLVFSMAPGYRDLYKCYLLLQHGLSISGSIFNLSLKDMAVLYEYWCFIKLNSLMREKYELQDQDIVKVNRNGLFVSLDKGSSSRVKYYSHKTGDIITLSYNASYKATHKESRSEMPTISQRPDNVFKLEKKGSDKPYEYVFDAKYRINPAIKDSPYEIAYGAPGPQEDDINTMHRYRDAIVYKNDANQKYERKMFGAYILFPYKNINGEYENHPFYKSIEKVNIGGLPFLPSETGLVSKMLDELISDSPDSAFERTTLPIGIEKKLAKVDGDNKDVMIGVVNDNQLMQCLDESSYYAYKSNVEDSLPIHYVALYNKENGIEYYGKVLTVQSVGIVTNMSGKEEEQYKFNIKEWIKLDAPIKPNMLGVFKESFTNKFLLDHSETYPELLFENEGIYRFYYELKRRSAEAMVDDHKNNRFIIGDYKVSFMDGDIIIAKNDSIVSMHAASEFANQPNLMFRRILSEIEWV